jgi:hypothetical protein
LVAYDEILDAVRERGGIVMVEVVLISSTVYRYVPYQFAIGVLP